jgi:O-antigen ligase
VFYLVWGSSAGSAFGYTCSHLLDLGSSTTTDRFMRWGLAWNFFKAHPFSDYVWVWSRYLVRLVDSYEPHNFFFEIATTEAIAGLAFYAVMLVAVARKALLGIWRDPETRALSCFLIAYVLFSTGNTNWYSYTTMPLLVAAVAGMAAIPDRPRLSAEAAPVAPGAPVGPTAD